MIVRAHLRRGIAVVLAALALSAAGLGISGCGATGHAIGGILAHRLANRLIGRRNAGKLFCIYHGHRVVVDLRTHHRFAAALNAYETYRSCKAGFGHSQHR